MSIPIICKAGAYTLILSSVVVVAITLLGLLQYLAESLLLVVIFFLAIDMFEREAVRLHRKV